MYFTHEHFDLGKEHQQELIRWRDHQRMLNKLPKLEPLPVVVVRAIVNRAASVLGSLRQPQGEPGLRNDVMRRRA